MRASWRAARQPVQPGDDQLVTVPDKVQRRGQLQPLGDRWDLLAEQPFAAGALEVALLGGETGLLFRGRGSCVADEHGICPDRVVRQP